MTFFGLVAVALYILYKRSTEIVTVNPLSGQRAPSPRPNETPDFVQVIGAIRDAAAQSQAAPLPVPGEAGEEFRRLVAGRRYAEAAQLYRRVNGGNMASAMKAIQRIAMQQ